MFKAGDRVVITHRTARNTYKSMLYGCTCIVNEVVMGTNRRGAKPTLMYYELGVWPGYPYIPLSQYSPEDFLWYDGEFVLDGPTRSSILVSEELPNI